MLENLLKDLLKLEERKDYREYNKGNIGALEMNNICDLAFIRCEFKRTLKSKQPSGLILTDSKNQNTRLCFTNSYSNPLDFNTLLGRERVLTSIKSWINNCIAEGVEPQKIAFI